MHPGEKVTDFNQEVHNEITEGTSCFHYLISLFRRKVYWNLKHIISMRFNDLLYFFIVRYLYCGQLGISPGIFIENSWKNFIRSSTNDKKFLLLNFKNSYFLNMLSLAIRAFNKSWALTWMLLPTAYVEWIRLTLTLTVVKLLLSEISWPISANEMSTGILNSRNLLEIFSQTTRFEMETPKNSHKLQILESQLTLLELMIILPDLVYPILSMSLA